MKTVRLMLAILAAATSWWAWADVPAKVVEGMPGLIAYQGTLKDPTTGAAYADGTYTLDVRLWSDATSTESSACLWGAQYSVFVKGGAFTLMLGDTNAKDLEESDGTVPTYGYTELWKAMWGANATDAVRYLGVTPRQDAQTQILESPVEIAPRQLLGTTPFVMRAESAQYAEGAVENFAVGGDLTVAKATTLAGGITAPAAAESQFGPIKASADQILLTGEREPTKTMTDSVWTVGSVVNLLAYYDLLVKPSTGDVTMSAASGRTVSVTGQGSFVSDTEKNTLGGTGATQIGSGSGGSVRLMATGGNTSGSTIVADESANSFNVWGGNSFNVSAQAVRFDNASYGALQGNPVRLVTKNGWSEVAANDGGVLGRGTFRIKDKPAFAKWTQQVTVSKKNHSSTFTISHSDVNSYMWFIAGFQNLGSRLQGSLDVSHSWPPTIYMRKHDAENKEQSVTVELIGIHRALFNL